MISGILALIGVIIGITSTSLINSKNRKDNKIFALREREDKYLFALIEKRFKVSQEAFQLCLQLRSIIHGKREIVNDTISTAQQWFDSNNLYLFPTIRKDIEDTINKVILYKDKLKLYYYSTQRDDSDKADEIYKEIENEFFQIMTLPKRIEDSLNLYYKVIEK
jgi:hypothetical protein